MSEIRSVRRALARFAGACALGALALLTVPGRGSGQERPAPQDPAPAPAPSPGPAPDPAQSPPRPESAGARVERLRPPALLVRDDPEKPQHPLRVVSMQADVRIAGGIASTTLELVFANDLPRVLEGELVLPLPRAASITRFALEVNGTLRDAVVVEREKARVAYEEVVRRGVDPGLVEWAAGNAFRTRVYPIPANGRKRLVLGYDEALEDVGGGRLGYALPLGFGAPLDTMRVAVQVAAGGATGAKLDADALAVPLELEAGGALSGSVGGEKIAPKDLRLTVAAGTGWVAIQQAAVRPAVGASPDLVFATQVTVPEVPGGATLPGRVTLLWDASGSAEARDAAAERAFVEALARRLGAAQVRLVVFSNAVWPEAGGAFEVKDGKAPALLERIAKIRPDGGTRLGCLDLRPLDGETDRYVLLSDGLSNFGDGEVLLGQRPVSCAVASERVDWRALERTARGGGAVVNLRALKAEDAVARALEEPLTLRSVDMPAAAGFAEVYPRAPARIDGRLLTVVGRRTSGEPAKLTLHLGRGAGPDVAVAVEVPGSPRPIPHSSDEKVGAVERVHAQRAIDELLSQPEPPEAEIVAIARRSGIVTPYTSLLVLDRLEDYVRHQVVPPKEMQDQYFQIVETQKAAEAKTREERLASLRKKWTARVEWWKKTFEYPPGLKVGEEDGKAEGGRHERRARESDGAGGTFLGNPRPAPSTPAPPPAEPAGNATGAAAAPGAQEERMSAAKAEKKKGGTSGADAASESTPAKPSIELAAWDPKTPYVEALKKAEPEGKEALYAAYLLERPKYASSSAFFLDVADFFFARKLDDLGLRILSNLAELDLESPPLLRILGYRLKQAGALDLAIATFKRVAKLRPEEPQSLRDLGLTEAAAERFEDAVPHLEKVVTGAWDGRFPDVELIVLGELNDVAARAKTKTGKTFHTLPADLVQVLDVDLRVILTWDADMCDMDLWVVEPSGEKAFYGHTATVTGGAFGRDFTRGYGPEEYLVKKAMPGKFKLQINYYGNSQQKLAGDTTIQVLVIKNWGRKDEQRTEVTRRLKDRKEVLDLAEVSFPE